jgi:hypothetical protein
MAEAVYILCALTSGICALLLLRNYRTSKVPLVMWTGVCFVAFTIGNILLFVDLVMVPSQDLLLWRIFASLFGATVLLYELIRSNT